MISPGHIRRDVPIPYYYQLIQMLREHLEAGTWTPGTAIPSEHELCALYGVSRTVVRQALAELTAGGLLYRVKGKGTFVSEHKVEERFVHRAQGFHRDMTSRGHTVATRVLAQKLVVPPAHISAHLRLPEHGQAIQINRLRAVDGAVLVYVQTYLPHDLCPSLVDIDLTDRSLYEVLREQSGLVLAGGTRSLEAVPARPPVTSLLEVRRGAPLLRIESIGYLDDGRSLEYYEAWHRGDRSKVEVEIVSSIVSLAGPTTP